MYRLIATKAGFQDFERKLEFVDGEAERTFVIDMVPVSANVAATSAYTPRFQPVAGNAPATRTYGTLNINAIPVSNLILDGKPLGPTPKIGVNVAPGAHTVIFVNPTHGRKAKSVTVEAGKTVSVVAKFP